MMRRTFIKALRASLLAFLIPQRRSGTKRLVGKELEYAAGYWSTFKKSYRKREENGYEPLFVKEDEDEYDPNWRMPAGRMYTKHTCGGASFDFLRDVETWNHETHKWEKWYT